MKKHIVKLKDVDMLCSKCVLKVLHSLAKIETIAELQIDLSKRFIKIVFIDESITKEMVIDIINKAIHGITPQKLLATT